MKTREFGKSIIELLGVLAIVGLLSIVAIGGYKVAIKKRNLNNLMDDVRLSAFIVADELFETLPKEDTSLESRFRPSSPYSFWAYKESETSFAIKVNSISADVCAEITTLKVDWIEKILLNGSKGVCVEGTENFITFFFNTGFDTKQTDFFGACTSDDDCGECGRCNGRACEYEKDKPVVSGNSCVACPQNAWTKSTQKSCRQCQETFFTVSDQCVSCKNNVYYYYATKEECLRCNKNGYNKYWIGGVYKDDPNYGYCYDCKGSVSSDGTKCDWGCPTGQIGMENAYECKVCTRGVSYAGVTHAQCLNCGDGWFFVNNYCYDCDRANSGSEMTKEECLGCNRVGANKYWYSSGNMRDGVSVGKCYDCDGVVSSDGTECTWTCEKGYIGVKGRYACMACGSSYYSPTTREQCYNCDNTYFEENISRCTLCSVGVAANVRKSDCDRCKNRYWVGTYIDETTIGSCKLCPSGQIAKADGSGCEDA